MNHFFSFDLPAYHDTTYNISPDLHLFIVFEVKLVCCGNVHEINNDTKISDTKK